MKHFVKILLFSLFICLLCALMLTSCEAEPSDGLDLEYYEDLNGYAVKGIGSCQDSDIVIPSEYNGKPVVAILSAAFFQNKTITSVTIPESIKSIEHIILYEYVVRTLILTQKIRAEFHDNTLRCHFLIKVMHLSWREK